MKPEIKACAECKYCKEYTLFNPYHKGFQCTHPEITTRPNVIWGGYFEEDVIDARVESKCGFIEANYWVAKESS